MDNIQLNLTEEEFNLIWGILNVIDLDGEDLKVQTELLNKMEDKIQEFNPDFFGVLTDDD